MTPYEFITKWRAVELKERSASQSHFNDLCTVLGCPTPIEADPKGEWFTFEKGATKTGGGDGWADVWKRGCFAWEYKGKRKNLDEAYVQLQRYAVALENPPLLIVSDMERFRIHTNWTNTVQQVYELTLDELSDSRRLRILRQAFSETEVEQLKPGKTRQELTEDIAAKFARIAKNLRDRGHEPHLVAHFVNRMLFCMFAEDVGLLPNQLFRRMLEGSKAVSGSFVENARKLFAAMREGGSVGFERVEWFNGGIFDDDNALSLTDREIEEALNAASLDWSNIDPSIMGTLFERGLDPDKRSQLGAHYTDREKIMKIVNPTIVEPLAREWEETRGEISKLMDRSHTHRDRTQRTRAYNNAVSLHQRHVERLKEFRILDPACGSGNFLYLSLHALKDLEHRANLEAEQLGLPFIFPAVGPECVLGIEINPYAAELARVSVWIGEIQWMRRNGFNIGRKPILKPLDTIQCRDAIINEDGSAAEWPDANVVIGNPPFLGAKLMKRVLGVKMTDEIRALYKGRLPGFTDLVCYWFENTRELIERGVVARAGLVATNSIRKNTNLPVMKRITQTSRIYEAWSEEQWDIDGAAVDVSLICFGDSGAQATRLNGAVVGSINPDLTTGLNLTTAKPLTQNSKAVFLGIQKSGPFDVPGELVRTWMSEPINPNGRRNAEVLKPYWNGDDVTGRPRDMWFIDLPIGLSKGDAALFTSPFRHLATTPDEDGKLVQELRAASGSTSQTYPWWQPWRPRSKMRSIIERLPRYIVTPETAQYRIFVWLSYPVLPDKNLIVVPREDDLMFGLLQSHFHAAWSLRKGSDLEDRPRYTHTTTFATFPFPAGMTPDVDLASARRLPTAPAIEAAAQRLNELRNRWLFPTDLVRRVSEVAPGFPDRLVPIDEGAARILTRRTLTTLYKEQPEWLIEAHHDLDRAVAAAYGWPEEIETEDALHRLLELNIARST
jgi:type II restriction/modification system DNA methylase subunit YeeA